MALFVSENANKVDEQTQQSNFDDWYDTTTNNHVTSTAEQNSTHDESDDPNPEIYEQYLNDDNHEANFEVTFDNNKSDADGKTGKTEEKTNELPSPYLSWSNKNAKFDVRDDIWDSPLKLHRLRVNLPKYSKQKQDIKILFLDVDGVLNYDKSQQPLVESHLKRLKNIIDKTNCKIVLSTTWRLIPRDRQILFSMLNYHIDVCNVIIGATPEFNKYDDTAKINIKWVDDDDGDGNDIDSSDYNTNEKNENKNDDMNINEQKIDDENNGKTSHYKIQGLWKDMFNYKFGDSIFGKERPFEIKAYLENDNNLKKYYNVIEWCAVDDLPLLKVNPLVMNKHFIQTDEATGMTDIEMNDIIKLLNKNNDQDKKNSRGQIDSNLKTNKKAKDNKKQEKCEKIRVLFLDVDGVLNCMDKDGLEMSNGISIIHLKRLKYILDNVDNCKIVLSTSWRLFEVSKETLIKEISKHTGYNKYDIVIGSTPSLTVDHFRSLEIKAWLDENETNKRYEILNWCAVDDLQLISNQETKEIMQNHFVKTDIGTGMTKKDATDIVNILNS